MSIDRLFSKDETWFALHVQTSQYFTQVVKCHDVKCCSPPRSSYFSLISKSRFLLPPIPLIQTRDGLYAPERTETEQFKFPSLFISLSLDMEKLLPRSSKSFKILPYDLYCPSVQSSLTDRICKVCNAYFGSITMLKKHHKIHQKPSDLVTKVRPLRIAARRQNELMAIIALQESEFAEWLDEDEVDCGGIVIPNTITDDTSMPVFHIEEHLASPGRRIGPDLFYFLVLNYSCT